MTRLSSSKEASRRSSGADPKRMWRTCPGPAVTGIVRAPWLSHEQLMAQTPRLRSPLVTRCLEDFRLGKRLPLETVAHLDLQSALHLDGVVNL